MTENFKTLWNENLLIKNIGHTYFTRSENNSMLFGNNYMFFSFDQEGQVR